MGGCGACRRVSEKAETVLLPFGMVKALDPGEERIEDIEAGADDFVAKTVDATGPPARVRSLLRIRALPECLRGQADEPRMSRSRDLDLRLERASTGRGHTLRGEVERCW